MTNGKDGGNIKPVAATGVFSLVPRTYQEAESLAKLMAESDMVPKDYKGKPGNVLIAVQMGLELDLKPMQAIQNLAVINGRPAIFGDLGKAILFSKGCKIDQDDIEIVKKNKRARCKITRPDGQVIERTFGEDDARTAKLWGKAGPWTDYPWRQMSWRAFWFAARDAAADMLKGVSGVEEVIDIDPDKIIDTETVKDEGPKRASESVPPPAIETKPDAVEIKPSPEVAPPETALPELPAESSEAKDAPVGNIIAVVGVVADIQYKPLGEKDKWDYLIKVMDAQGPVYLHTTSTDMAKVFHTARHAKKTVVAHFRIEGARNEVCDVTPGV
jgi:hypothetical protein